MYKHEHVYVYQFEVKNHPTWHGVSTCKMEYSLCTNIDGPNHKENRSILEQMLRTVYGYMPKGVKFLHEKIQ
jgi:hypothetical protein